MVAGLNPQSYDTTEASASNRLKLTSGNQCSGTKQGFCYDSAGNLIFDNQTGSGDRTYDAENRMISGAGGGINYYVYDADGKRVRRFVGAQQFRQVYGIDGELVAEYAWNDVTQTATLQKEYGYRSGEMLIVGESSAVKWLVKDHLGTPRMIADQTGSYGGVKRHDYYPFGEENLTGSGTVRTSGYGFQPADGVRQKHTGYERDGETGMDFAQARYYANLQGRFTGPDLPFAAQFESDPQSWNLYAYVRNNPCANTDSTGRGTCFYDQSGSKIGCEGDTRIKLITEGDKGNLIFTPKKGAPVVYDLNTISAVTSVSPAPNPIGDLSVEMQRRGPGVQGLIGVTIGTGVIGGITGGVGLYALGSGAGITTLGLSQVALPIPTRLALLWSRLSQARPARSAEEALKQISKILDGIEDSFSGIPKNPNPGLRPDGRMYPPQSDFITKNPDGSITAITRGPHYRTKNRAFFVSVDSTEFVR